MNGLSNVKINNRIPDYTASFHKSCPFCGSRILISVCHKNRIEKCSECGQAFRQEISKSIIEGYKDKPAMPSWLESRAAARHHYNFINKTAGFDNIKSILEIGAGDGVLLKMIRKKNKHIDITAVEPSESHCRTLSEIPNITVCEDYAENVVFDRRFDLVIMSHVLEHFKAPLQTIKYIYDDLLCENGYLYIDIPNQDYELMDCDNSANASANHLYFFNGANMPDLLSSAGFDKLHFHGVKYKTLPVFYGHIRSFTGKMENEHANRYYIFLLKAINKMSLYTSLLSRNLTGAYPKEISINDTDHRYNNIAIMVRK